MFEIKKTIILVSSLFILASCSGITQESWDVDSDTGMMPTSQTSTDIQSDEESSFISNWNQISSEYRNNAEVNSCMNQSLNQCFTPKVQQDSLASLDTSICKNLLTEQLQSDCADFVYNAIALENGVFSECDIIVLDSLRLNCRYNMIQQNTGETCEDMFAWESTEVQEQFKYLFNTCNTSDSTSTWSTEVPPVVVPTVAPPQNLQQQSVAPTVLPQDLPWYVKPTTPPPEVPTAF